MGKCLKSDSMVDDWRWFWVDGFINCVGESISIEMVWGWRRIAWFGVRKSNLFRCRCRLGYILDSKNEGVMKSICVDMFLLTRNSIPLKVNPYYMMSILGWWLIKWKHRTNVGVENLKTKCVVDDWIIRNRRCRYVDFKVEYVDFKVEWLKFTGLWFGKAWFLKRESLEFNIRSRVLLV